MVTTMSCYTIVHVVEVLENRYYQISFLDDDKNR
jgi:hypothetical protein